MMRQFGKTRPHFMRTCMLASTVVWGILQGTAFGEETSKLNINPDPEILFGDSLRKSGKDRLRRPLERPTRGRLLEGPLLADVLFGCRTRHARLEDRDDDFGRR